MAIMMTTLRNQFNRLLVLVLVIVCLNGCVTTQYGNFIENPSIVANHAMAEDVAAQIMRLYPAASTQLNLNHVVNDPFGLALIDKLRQSGFAVFETVHEPINILSRVEPQTTEQDLTQPQKGIALSYVVDQSGELYHAKLYIGDRFLSRAFILRDDVLHAAGHWVSRQ